MCDQKVEGLIVLRLECRQIPAASQDLSGCFRQRFRLTFLMIATPSAFLTLTYLPEYCAHLENGFQFQSVNNQWEF
jgi:hypothetical protein